MSSLTLSKEEEKRLKGLGFLNNKGTDNFSARILTVMEKLPLPSTGQWQTRQKRLETEF